MTARPPHLPDFVRLLHDLSAFAAGGKIERRGIGTETPPSITLLEASPVPPAPVTRRAEDLLRQMRRRVAQFFRLGDGE